MNDFSKFTHGPVIFGLIDGNIGIEQQGRGALLLTQREAELFCLALVGYVGSNMEEQKENSAKRRD